MNTVQSMFNNNESIQALRDQGYGSADFEVAVAPLQYPIWNNAEKRISSKSVIYRTDTGEELGVAGHGRTAPQPRKLVDNLRNVLERSPIDTTGIKESIQTSHNGSRIAIQTTLPAYTFDTPDGDTASLSLLCISSYDGSWLHMMSAAATQFACTNLQVFVGGEVAVYKSKHTRSLDIEMGGRIINKALDVFHNERELWLQWNQTQVREMEALKFFADSLDVKLETGDYPNAVLSSLPRRNENLNYMWNVYSNVYKKRLGSNYWAVYNAMTDWSTHFGAVRKSSEQNIAAIQHDRQQVVRKAVRSNPFLMKAA